MFYSYHVLNCLVKCVLYKHINRSRLYTAHNLRAFIKSRLQPSSYLYQFGIGFEFIPLNMLNSIFRQHLSTKNKDELRSWLKNHCTKMLKRCKNNLLHNTWRNTIIIKKPMYWHDILMILIHKVCIYIIIITAIRYFLATFYYYMYCPWYPIQ